MNYLAIQNIKILYSFKKKLFEKLLAGPYKLGGPYAASYTSPIG